MEHLKVVFKVLKENQLFTKYSKLCFGLVPFVGNIFPKEMKNYPWPLSSMDIWISLGLDCYYTRFVDGVSSIASPLKT